MKANGFRVPETLVTNDIDAAETFRICHPGPVVFKSVSGARAQTQTLDERNYARLHLLPECPTQFQPLIPGVDVRVHVIGDQCFGLRIESSEVDYRYARKGFVRMESCALPTIIQNQCRRITRVFGLYLSGIDFRVTSNDEWYGLEVNPAPAFTEYELQTGQPLASALLDLLHELSSKAAPPAF
jgi:glutathione synthase/RimK-type ligase-like ATP-grasp enzyme